MVRVSAEPKTLAVLRNENGRDARVLDLSQGVQKLNAPDVLENYQMHC